jgi:hypothetical protein
MVFFCDRTQRNRQVASPHVWWAEGRNVRPESAPGIGRILGAAASKGLRCGWGVITLDSFDLKYGRSRKRIETVNEV